MLEIKYLSTSLHFQAKMITKPQFEVMAFSIGIAQLLTRYNKKVKLKNY